MRTTLKTHGRIIGTGIMGGLAATLGPLFVAGFIGFWAGLLWSVFRHGWDLGVHLCR